MGNNFICIHHPCQVEWLSEKMREMNLAISSMHGDMPQKDREIVIQEFRNGVK